jgi:hypothetical protein
MRDEIEKTSNKKRSKTKKKVINRKWTKFDIKINQNKMFRD